MCSLSWIQWTFPVFASTTLSHAISISILNWITKHVLLSGQPCRDHASSQSDNKTVSTENVYIRKCRKLNNLTFVLRYFNHIHVSYSLYLGLFPCSFFPREKYMHLYHERVCTVCVFDQKLFLFLLG